jgi:hypothetical protein
MMTWNKQFCSLALGLIVYDYYSAVATNTTTYASGGSNATDDFLSAHSRAAELEQRYKKMAKRKERLGGPLAEVAYSLSNLPPLNKQYLYLPLGSVSRISSP